MKKSATNIRLGAQNRRPHVGLGVFKSKMRMRHVAPQKGATLPGCVGQSEAPPLEVDATVHHHLTEQQRRVPGRSARGIFGGAPRRTCLGSGHELEEPGQPLFMRNVLQFGLLGALRAQLAHGGRSQRSPGLG